MQLYISIAAFGYFDLGNRYTLSTIFGRDLAAPRAREERLAHIAELVIAYVTSDAAGLPQGGARR